MAAAAAAAAGCGGDAAAPEGRPLLPDLDQAVPLTVSLRRRGGRDLVVFAAALDNVGEGPLVVHGSRPSAATAETTATGIWPATRCGDVRSSAAAAGVRRKGRLRAFSLRARGDAGALHLIGFVRYELRTADGRVARTGGMVGFCLGDRYDSRRSARLDGEPAEPVWADEFGKGRAESFSSSARESRSGTATTTRRTSRASSSTSARFRPGGTSSSTS